MREKQAYEAPNVESWGTISEVTQGTGMTSETDDFTSATPSGPFSDGFIGSNGNETLRVD